ncbi:MAG: hypothetical protein AAF696_37860, partial [Bacteroidota bacterium]
MKLPIGISGFTRIPPQYPEELLTEIEKGLRELPNCQVLEVHPIGLSNNYHEFELRYFQPPKNRKGIHCSVLLNSVYAYWAMIDKEKSSWMQLVFIEPPLYLKEKLNMCMQEVDLTSLTQKIDSACIENLDKSEKKQINYWDSQT